MTPRQLLAQAFRSGLYTQGKDIECRIVNGKPIFCALGVAGMVYKEATGIDPFDVAEENTRIVKEGPVRRWLGMTPQQIGAMVNANDEGMSFPALADWVEAL